MRLLVKTTPSRMALGANHFLIGYQQGVDQGDQAPVFFHLYEAGILEKLIC